ncbi:hypothetical protein JOQ06_028732 [Pogonophryne albipinna]|uniref:ZP domain-containing protein n=1 Tax=Pogonophryne albipinna TaxID=1090488 RepID=A0AAD6B716_9TELE|nr:hypothetical protein JOQ06_028732 [Pogonophryne albipinna]
MMVPRVEVFCDESKLTLLVDKRFNGVVLTGEELQLGGGCYSNGELPNQFVFTYSLDECGTTPVLYIHCSVLKSDHGVNTGSKSCNYNIMQSRWEDLRGNAEVCECCIAKCRGLSVKHLSEDAKAIVSTGPLVVVDKRVEMSPQPSLPEMQETTSAPHARSMQSDGAAIVSGTSLSRPPQGVVVVSQDPVARLTLWLPGQVQDPEHGESKVSEDKLTVKLQARDTTSRYIPEQRPLTSYQEPPLNAPTNKIRDHGANELKDGHIFDLNLLTPVDGWPIPTQMEKAAFADEAQIKKLFGRPGMFEASQEVDIPLIAEMTLNILNQHDFNQMRDELAEEAVMPRDEATDSIIRSKVQFSKGMDGSQTLSYEEEVMREQEGKGVTSRFGMDGNKRKPETKRRGLRSAFLDLIRSMDKAE